MIHSVQEHITSHLAALPSEIKHLTVGLALDPLGRHKVALAGGSSTRNSYVSVKLRISTSALCSMMWSRDSMRQSMRIIACIKLFPCSGLWCFTITSLLSFHFPLNCSYTGPSPKNLNAFRGLSLSCNKHMHRSRLPQNQGRTHACTQAHTALATCTQQVSPCCHRAVSWDERMKDEPFTTLSQGGEASRAPELKENREGSSSLALEAPV